MKENLSAIYKMEARKCINVYGYTYKIAAAKYEHRFAEGDLMQNIMTSPTFDIVAAEIYDYYNGRYDFEDCRDMAGDVVVSILGLRSPTTMNEICSINPIEHGPDEVPYPDCVRYDGDLVRAALSEVIERVVDCAGSDLQVTYNHLVDQFSQTMQVFYGQHQIVTRASIENVQFSERAFTGELSS